MTLLFRRNFLKILSTLPVALAGISAIAKAETCNIDHPFIPPKSSYQGQCPVCGMIRPMWARTWMRFAPHHGVNQTCSFHCLADWITKTQEEPKNIHLALYHEPERMIPKENAYIVVGSSAAGTMSPVSKIVFEDKNEAQKFSNRCGGETVDFENALEKALATASKENVKINARRLAKGKIVEPKDSDQCIVCNMRPAKYPYGKCQLHTKDKTIFHFCSTQCLFAFFGNQSLYAKREVEPILIWVVDRNTGMWISGRTAFYVIGSTKVFGPMGYEALVHGSLSEARLFAAENGGRIIGFQDISIEKIVPGWRYSD